MIETPATLENLSAFTDAARKAAVAAELPERRVNDVELAVEEIFVNICDHASDSSGGTALSARLEHDENDETLKLVISDPGQPFNPLEHPEPDTNAHLEKRAVGGLGIFLVKKLMDDTLYERLCGRNVLTLIVDKRSQRGN
jgi:anti-sigma regulatory factor (Ser/Thr protein kinase)